MTWCWKLYAECWGKGFHSHLYFSTGTIQRSVDSCLWLQQDLIPKGPIDRLNPELYIIWIQEDSCFLRSCTRKPTKSKAKFVTNKAEDKMMFYWKRNSLLANSPWDDGTFVWHSLRFMASRCYSIREIRQDGAEKSKCCSSYSQDELPSNIAFTSLVFMSSNTIILNKTGVKSDGEYGISGEKQENCGINRSRGSDNSSKKPPPDFLHDNGMKDWAKIKAKYNSFRVILQLGVNDRPHHRGLCIVFHIQKLVWILIIKFGHRFRADPVQHFNHVSANAWFSTSSFMKNKKQYDINKWSFH